MAALRASVEAAKKGRGEDEADAGPRRSAAKKAPAKKAAAKTPAKKAPAKKTAKKAAAQEVARRRRAGRDTVARPRPGRTGERRRGGRRAAAAAAAGAAAAAVPRRGGAGEAPPTGRHREPTPVDRRSPMSEMPLESPAEDAAEQRQEAFPDGPRAADSAETALEVDPADARSRPPRCRSTTDAWP